MTKVLERQSECHAHFTTGNIYDQNETTNQLYNDYFGKSALMSLFTTLLFMIIPNYIVPISFIMIRIISQYLELQQIL